MRKTRTYTDLEKQQILEEVKNTGNVAAVAKKNKMPAGTIHTWLHQGKKNLPNSQPNQNKLLKEAKVRINDLELENKILKELLKKTYQIWDTD